MKNWWWPRTWAAAIVLFMFIPWLALLILGSWFFSALPLWGRLIVWPLWWVLLLEIWELVAGEFDRWWQSRKERNGGPSL